MSLRVIGAGVGRTGTQSLKTALEELLDGRCYHGEVVFWNGRHVKQWLRAVRGEPVDWRGMFDGYAAAVDWPVSAFWEELAAEYPDALIVLSTRDSADDWYRSARDTIFQYAPLAKISRAVRMHSEVIAARFAPDVMDADAAKAAYERHNAHVRATAPAGRLVEWKPGDGWEPLCAALGLPVPERPFPRRNSTGEWNSTAMVFWKKVAHRIGSRHGVS